VERDTSVFARETSTERDAADLELTLVGDEDRRCSIGTGERGGRRSDEDQAWNRRADVEALGQRIVATGEGQRVTLRGELRACVLDRARRPGGAAVAGRRAIDGDVDHRCVWLAGAVCVADTRRALRIIGAERAASVGLTHGHLDGTGVRGTGRGGVWNRLAAVVDALVAVGALRGGLAVVGVPLGARDRAQRERDHQTPCRSDHGAYHRPDRAAVARSQPLRAWSATAVGCNSSCSRRARKAA
jgi:hypothetical protein